MNDGDWADRFSADVDGLLREVGRMERESLPIEYHQAVNLARTLAVTDFSAESQRQQSLRRRLLNQIGVRQGWQQRVKRAMHALLEPHRPAVTAVAVFLVSLLVATLAWPGASTTVAQSIGASVRQLVLGRHTTVTQTASPGALATVSVTVHPVSATPMASASPNSARIGPVEESPGNLCIINTAIGRYGFSLLSDGDTVVRRLRTFEEAQAAVPFDLRRPGYLPDGYTLCEALVVPGGSAFLFYESPSGNIVLVQVSVGVPPGGDAEEAHATAVQVLTTGAIEPVTLNGQPAGWVEGHGLMWEAGGVSYTVGGGGLSLEEAIRIAESLE